MAGHGCCITLARTLRVSLTSVLNSEASDPLLSVSQLSLSPVLVSVPESSPDVASLLDAPESTSDPDRSPADDISSSPKGVA